MEIDAETVSATSPLLADGLFNRNVLKYNSITPAPTKGCTKQNRFKSTFNNWYSTISCKMKKIYENHEKYISKQNATIVMVFLVFVFSRAMDRVFAKRVSDRMENYNMLYVAIIWPIAMLLIQWLMALGYVYYQRLYCKQLQYNLNWFSFRSKISSSKGAYPQWKITLFALWDQLNATVTTLPTPFLSLTAQGLLSNSTIIFTVIISLIWLGTRYSACHYIGCLLVVISGLVSITVEIQSGNGFQYQDDKGILHNTSLMWYLIYVIGNIPAGISNCWKQKCLKEVNLDIMWASTWSGAHQVLWGFVFFPLNWIPLPAPAARYTPSSTPQYFVDGWACFFGHPPSGKKSDLLCYSNGSAAWEWFILYVMFNLLFNVLLLWLTKHLSSTWSAIATVLCLDLASLFSMSTILMGSEATPLTFEQWLGLIIAGVAMWTYNLQEERDAKGNLVRGTCDDEYNEYNVSNDINTNENGYHPLFDNKKQVVKTDTFTGIAQASCSTENILTVSDDTINVGGQII